jgi:hypothetical protein
MVGNIVSCSPAVPPLCGMSTTRSASATHAGRHGSGNAISLPRASLYGEVNSCLMQERSRFRTVIRQRAGYSPDGGLGPTGCAAPVLAILFM